MDVDSAQFQLALVATGGLGLALVAGSLMSALPAAPSIGGSAIGLAVALGALWSWKSRWFTGKANEWILVVRNGRMVKAGVGLTVFRGMYDTVVSFPSVIQKVSFAAEQVSKEVQGLHVSGFCIWSVNRVDDGPFKAYRYLDGLSTSGLANANDNLGGFAVHESQKSLFAEQ
uniref:Uncharacterized protein n=1 Tax=Chlamydomonas euryale TaxID=1486919 RepID=A0A7R9Z8H8_9CHLO|mmetsp:Transcript_8206/g.24769  ORF Transcript_8206/g.24769 Transcript_8206/m.24769 type:complete len:172 (+) Transcript_8206:143-658(+)